jgi:uncharacterized protein
MSQGTTPVFRQLNEAEMRELLERNHVGRIAFSFHDRVDIEPIHYACSGDWLYCRTSAGAKLATLAHRPWVAFEVDEVSGVFDWRSVVARGVAYQISGEGSESERRQYARAVELLRGVVPETLAARDPVPFRGVVLAIHLDEMTGRAASTG